MTHIVGRFVLTEGLRQIKMSDALVVTCPFLPPPQRKIPFWGRSFIASANI
jgi:hypothetical protein